MMLRKTLLIAGILAFIVALLSNSGVADEYFSEETGTNAWSDLSGDRPDIIAMAKNADTTPQEMLRRLRQRESIDNMYSHLKSSYPQHFGGLYIEHKPDYRVVVLFANDVPADISQAIPDDIEGDVEIRTVSFTYLELEQAHTRARTLLQNSDLSFHSSIDVQKNVVNIYVPQTVTESYEEVLSRDPSLANKVNLIKGGLEVLVHDGLNNRRVVER
ncbi:MAG: hypothetical protein GXP37_04315 [Chloroflexi bacterium]|nr:hypothetical protein [Chloroflexota bacterium]